MQSSRSEADPACSKDRSTLGGMHPEDLNTTLGLLPHSDVSVHGGLLQRTEAEQAWDKYQERWKRGTDSDLSTVGLNDPDNPQKSIPTSINPNISAFQARHIRAPIQSGHSEAVSDKQSPVGRSSSGTKLLNASATPTLSSASDFPLRVFQLGPIHSSPTRIEDDADMPDAPSLPDDPTTPTPGSMTFDDFQRSCRNLNEDSVDADSHMSDGPSPTPMSSTSQSAIAQPGSEALLEKYQSKWKQPAADLSTARIGGIAEGMT